STSLPICWRRSRANWAWRLSGQTWMIFCKAAAALWGWPLRIQLSARAMYVSASESSRSVQACCNCSGLSLVGATFVRTRPRGRSSRDWIDEGGSGEYPGLTHHFSQRFQGSEPVQSTSTRFSTPPGGGDGGCSFLYFFSGPEQEPTPLSPPGKVLRTN